MTRQTDSARRTPDARTPRLGLVPVGRGDSVPPARSATSRVGADETSLERDLDTRVRDLLVRVSEQERLARAADSDLEDFFAWPSWSMDTGLTPAQEQFVEHWSPQQVLEDSRSVRELLEVLQHWSITHRGDAGIHEALTVLTGLHQR